MSTIDDLKKQLKTTTTVFENTPRKKVKQTIVNWFRNNKSKVGWVISSSEVIRLPFNVASSNSPLDIPGSLSLAHSSLVALSKSLSIVLIKSLSFSSI